MNNRFRFDAPSVADEEELDDQLVAYNLRKVPCRQGETFVKFCRCAYNEKNELERIMDEKIYEITNKIFMYFQIKGCSIQMSNGCNPYSIIIVDDVKIG